MQTDSTPSLNRQTLGHSGVLSFLFGRLSVCCLSVVCLLLVVVGLLSVWCRYGVGLVRYYTTVYYDNAFHHFKWVKIVNKDMYL